MCGFFFLQEFSNLLFQPAINSLQSSGAQVISQFRSMHIDK